MITSAWSTTDGAPAVERHDLWRGMTGNSGQCANCDGWRTRPITIEIDDRGSWQGSASSRSLDCLRPIACKPPVDATDDVVDGWQLHPDLTCHALHEAIDAFDVARAGCKRARGR